VGVGTGLGGDLNGKADGYILAGRAWRWRARSLLGLKLIPSGRYEYDD
jgi:hypothetical protein